MRAVRSDKSIIKGLQREHDRLIEMGREVEAELRRVVDVNKRLEAANAAKDAALKECQRLATERIRTADAAVKADVYAADALMGIAVLARAALSDTCQHPLNHIEHLKRDLIALRGEVEDTGDTCECDYPHTSDFEPPFEACTCNPDCYHLTASRDIQEAIRKAAKGDEPCPS